MAYNPSAAISYAHRWAKARNPRWFNFDPMGGDCTNFISQCLNAGGCDMNSAPDSGWFYYDIDSRSPSWSSVEHLHDFIVANQGPGPQGSDGAVADVRPGDIIQLSFDNNTFEHSLFVVDPNNGDPLICCHTYDSENRPLSSYIYVKARAIIMSY